MSTDILAVVVIGLGVLVNIRAWRRRRNPGAIGLGFGISLILLGVFLLLLGDQSGVSGG